MQKIIVVFIRAYRYLLSPWMARSCRFYPSCSHYAEDAIIQHGVINGVGMTIKRVCRCHPWNAGGFDPVPPVRGGAKIPAAKFKLKRN